MSHCCDGPTCASPKAMPAGQAPCPHCGATGRPVGDETIRALLKPELVTSMLAVERRFCRTPSCDVLYYGADGRFVDKSTATIRVGLKETADPIPICYCFGFFRTDVEQEVLQTGSSTIPAQITARVRAGECACEVKNPSGTCCLGDVNRAVKEAKDALSQARKESRPGDALTASRGKS